MLNKKLKLTWKFLLAVTLVFMLACSVNAQSTSGTSYSSDRISTNSGSSNSTGNSYSTESAVSQSVVGESSSSNYNAQIGFFYTTGSTEGSDPPSPEEQAQSSGGGFGGLIGGILKPKEPKLEEPKAVEKYDFTAFTFEEETIFKTQIIAGKLKNEKIFITNTGNQEITITIDYSDFSDFVYVKETEITLAAGETREIEIAIFSKDDELPEVYTGKIYIKGEGIEKTLAIIVEVKEKYALFDVAVSIPEEHKAVKTGSYVLAEISIFNFGDLMPVDVEIDYEIRDLEGNTIESKHETMAVEDTLNITRGMKVPSYLKPGKYLLYTKVTYNNQTATSSELFEVVEKGFNILLYLAIFFAVLITVVLTVVLIRWVNSRPRKEKTITKKQLKQLKKESEKIAAEKIFEEQMSAKIQQIEEDHSEKKEEKLSELDELDIELKEKAQELDQMNEEWETRRAAVDEDKRKVADTELDIQKKVSDFNRLVKNFTFMKSVPRHEHLVLKDSTRIRNLEELLYALKSIDNRTFRHHLNKRRNDFSRFAELIDQGTAKKLKKAKTRDSMIKILTEKK
ncbi:MAG: hypothetical protein GY861_06855 [bacterium]|nr:hypothetical protein [bacterium]